MVGDAKNFTVANETFTAKDTADDKIVAFNPTSRYVMGNEIDPFLVEIKQDMQPVVRFCPMQLQQKTLQATLRASENDMYLCGGTDSTKTKLSKKAYHFNMTSGVIQEHTMMNEGRHSFPLAYDG